MWSRVVRQGTVVRLVTSLGLSLIVVLPASSWARDCSFRVVVEGDEPARTSLAKALSKADVTDADSTCPAETVQVRTADGVFELTITDPYGRVTHRTVADLEAATAVVEATPGSDALRPLLPEVDISNLADEMPRNISPASSSGPASTLPAVVSASRAPDSVPERDLSLSFSTELATGFDGSSWAGAALNGCVRLGPTCLGTTIRFWNDLEPGEESANAIHYRGTGEIAVAVDVPVTHRRFSVRPGVELGLGWIHIGEFSASRQPSDDADVDQGQVVAGAHLVVSYRLAQHWAVETGVGATLSIFAHHRPFVVQGIQLPGEPLAFGVVSLGTRYGTP